MYRIMKSFTSFHDSSIKKFVVSAVSKELIENNIKIPNAKTLQTFTDDDSKKNLEECNDFSHLLYQMNLDE